MTTAPQAKQAQHTPTPWKVNGHEVIWYDKAHGTYTIRDGVRVDDARIATVAECRSTGIWDGNPEHSTRNEEANADFIVRACNSHAALVAALREIVAKVEDREGMGDLGGKPDAYLRAIRDVARAALQKAEA